MVEKIGALLKPSKRHLFLGRNISNQGFNSLKVDYVKKVFISGPIIGMENQQDYRKTVTEIVCKIGFEIIDPWKRERVLYNGTEECWWDKVPTFDFVQRDLDDADRCDIMVVYLPILSAGACMEMFYAKRKGKKIIVISEMECLSPWIVFHSDAIIKDFGKLEEALKKFL
jgi:nucleoside 2-deoxyribosyltransferase